MTLRLARLPLLPLFAGMLLLPAGRVGAAPACAPSPAPTQWLERPIGADCLDCWQKGEVPPARTLALDWIVPAGDDAPLSAAALAEATQRLGTPPQPRRQRLPRPPRGVTLAVDSGLAWHGYVALTFDLKMPRNLPLPSGAVGWVALVERVRAGEDGSGVDRRLVRALAGPLTLPVRAGGNPLQHVLAVRLPDNAQGDRLAAVGWIEQADGRLWLAAESAPRGCNPAGR